MFTLIPHKDKDQTSLGTSFIKDEVLYPAEVMVKTSSGYKVLALYVRDSTGHLYAKNGAFFISLMHGGLTSNSKVTWSELSGVDEMYDRSYLTYYKPMDGLNAKD